MSEVLARWNALPLEDAACEILALLRFECVGRGDGVEKTDVRGIRACLRPRMKSGAASAKRIGWKRFAVIRESVRSRAEKSVAAQSSAWSEQEQQKAATAEEAIKTALKWGNREYEQKFGRIFIVCATGKSASEILEILRRRLHNDDATELQQAAEEQRQIMHIRLKKWIAG